MDDALVVAVLRSLAQVSEAFDRIASRLRSLPGVRTVSHPMWIRAEERVAEDQFRVGQGTGFRIEWYAEADFVDGRGISFGQELSWHQGEWTVDASVRASDQRGEHILVEFPRRYAVDSDDLVAELHGQTQLVVGSQEEGIRLFLQY